MKGRKFQRQYKNHLSGFKTWGQKPHAEDWLIFPENISEELSLDEVALSDGELYTVLTSKKAKGRKGAIVAVVKGTRSEDVVTHFRKIPQKLRKQVKEITLDMSGSMKLIARNCFYNAAQTVDRFHVQKLALEALQEIRIKHRWEAMEKENQVLIQAKSKVEKPELEIFENGDSLKQFLARSRYLLYKSRENWTPIQKQRAEILFQIYPDLQQAYQLTDELRKIYNQKIIKSVAMLKLAHWFKEVEEFENKAFNTVTRTITAHYNDILNYFTNRSTNASAESFNAKIKNFRIQLRGVKDRSFFLYRLTTLFA